MNDTFCKHGTHWHHACHLCDVPALATKAIEPCQGGIRFVREQTPVGVLTTIEHMRPAQRGICCGGSCAGCVAGAIGRDDE